MIPLSPIITLEILEHRRQKKQQPATTAMNASSNNRAIHFDTKSWYKLKSTFTFVFISNQFLDFFFCKMIRQALFYSLIVYNEVYIHSASQTSWGTTRTLKNSQLFLNWQFLWFDLMNLCQEMCKHTCSPGQNNGGGGF